MAFRFLPYNLVVALKDGQYSIPSGRKIRELILD